MWDCEGNKCVEPHGYNFNFIKLSWKYLKDDLVKVMVEFHRNRKLPKGCNASFISLIPKLEYPQSLGDFIPISLVGCIYKIISKILAGRLKKDFLRS